MTVENYLKTILQLEESPVDPASTARRGAVSTGSIAKALDVSPGTVTAMLKTLESNGLAKYRPYAGVRLSAKGRGLALHVLRRHRLVELFLVETLGMDWGEVHEEAEVLEHAVSDRLLDRLDAFLGHPEVDPHGDPIPPADGALPPSEHEFLGDAEASSRWVVVRLFDQSPAFLEMAERNRLLPGAKVVVRRVDSASEVLHLTVEGKRLSVSTAVASKIAVTGA